MSRMHGKHAGKINAAAKSQPHDAKRSAPAGKDGKGLNMVSDTSMSGAVKEIDRTTYDHMPLHGLHSKSSHGR